MSKLIQLRQRMQAIKKTCKITRAMRLMSMSLYTKLEKQSVSIARYRSRITSLFRELNVYVHDWKNPLLFPDDILDATPLYIMISSSKGLCGSYNTNMMRFFEKEFFLENHQKPSFITIGTKAQTFLKNKNFGTIIHHEPILNTGSIVEVATNVSSAIQQGGTLFSSVTFFSNSLKNFFIQKPLRKQIIPLPLDIPEISRKKDLADANNITFEEEPLWEQSTTKIMDTVAQHYIKSLLLDIMLDALLSEHAARFMAMDHSTTNAENYLERLTLEYNKSRQAVITRELAELSASFADLG